MNRGNTICPEIAISSGAGRIPALLITSRSAAIRKALDAVSFSGFIPRSPMP